MYPGKTQGINDIRPNREQWIYFQPPALPSKMNIKGKVVETWSKLVYKLAL